MRLALATHQPGPLPESDELLRRALERRGVNAVAEVWSHPGVGWHHYDAVVIRSCWDYHLRLPEWLAWLDRVPVPLINPAPLIRWNLDKRYLAQLDVPLPDSVWLANADDRVDLGHLCRSRRWPAAVVKPLVSASAWRTELRTAGVAQGPALVQEYLPEISRGEWSLMYFQSVYSHAVRKMPAPGDFRVQSEFGGGYAPATPPRAVLELGGRVLAQLPEPPALARIDIVERLNADPVLMEAEVIEPELFLTESSAAPSLAAAAVLRAVLALEPVR
mgnify:CR=1 FL=1